MIPHQLRLYAIGVLLALDVAALLAAHYGLPPELAADLRVAIESSLLGAGALLGPAMIDAIAIERRRRNPAIAAIEDDVRRQRALVYRETTETRASAEETQR